MHPEGLELRFLPTDQRTDEQAGGEPRGRDPKDPDLNVPRTGDAIRQDVRDLDAIEAIAFHAVVGCHHAQENLNQDQSGDHPEVLQRRTLGGGRGPGPQRIRGRDRPFGFGRFLRGIPPDHRANAGQQHNDADARPHHALAGGAIADLRVVRPVVCIGDGVARPLGRGGPGSPEDESCELPHALRSGDAPGRYRIRSVSLHENIGEVRQTRFERTCADGRNSDGVRRSVVTVLTVELLETPAEFASIFGRELLVWPAEFGVRPLRENEGRLAMQPVGGPIWSDIAAMAPYGADFHTAERLPHILASGDVSIGHNDGAGGIDDACGNWRHLLIDARANPAQHGKRDNKYEREANPKLFHLSFLSVTSAEVFPQPRGVWRQMAARAPPDSAPSEQTCLPRRLCTRAHPDTQSCFVRYAPQPPRRIPWSANLHGRPERGWSCVRFVRSGLRRAGLWNGDRSLRWTCPRLPVGAQHLLPGGPCSPRPRSSAPFLRAPLALCQTGSRNRHRVRGSEPEVFDTDPCVRGK